MDGADYPELAVHGEHLVAERPRPGVRQGDDLAADRANGATVVVDPFSL